MQRNDRSANQVAKLAGYQSNSQVSRVLRGEEPVPFERINDFADGLGLIDEREREYWTLIVRLSHSPPEIRELFWKIQDQLEILANLRIGAYERATTLAERTAQLEQQVSTLLAENRKLKGHG